MHPWDPEVWPLLRTSSSGSPEEEPDQQTPYPTQESDIMEDLEAVLKKPEDTPPSPGLPARPSSDTSHPPQSQYPSVLFLQVLVVSTSLMLCFSSS
jgi:hypothetical protein